jgi:hypothetical protein
MPAVANLTIEKSRLLNKVTGIEIMVHTKKNSVALVRERTIPAKLPPLIREISANFCG